MLTSAGKVLDEWLALPNALRVFRAYPGDPNWLVYKEGLPFRGVWALHRQTDMEGTEWFFQLTPMSKLELLGGLPWFLGFIPFLNIAWNRRAWLKANATRVAPSVWRQATRLH